jgi:hypothetical protein
MDEVRQGEQSEATESIEALARASTQKLDPSDHRTVPGGNRTHI